MTTDRNFLRDIEDFIEGDPDPKKKLQLNDYFPELVDMYKNIDVPIIGKPISIFQRMMNIISGCKIDTLHKFTTELYEMWIKLSDIEQNLDNFNKIMKNLRKKHHFQPRKIHIRAYYSLLIYNNDVSEIDSLNKFLVIKNMRSLSGIISVSVIIDPYPKWVDPRNWQNC